MRPLSLADTPQFRDELGLAGGSRAWQASCSAFNLSQWLYLLLTLKGP